MKRFIRIFIVLALLIGGGLLVIMLSYDSSIKKDSPHLTPDSTSLDTEVPVVGRRLVPSEFSEVVSASGVLEAWHRTMLSSETGGRVVEWTAGVGDLLDSGHVILRFDDELATLQMNQSRANLEAARVAMAKQERDLERLRNLFEQGNMSRNEYEAAELGYKGAEASLAGAEAAMGLAARTLKETSVRMPYRGHLSAKIAIVGQSLAPGMPVAEVVKINPIHIEVGLTESDIVRAKTGQPVTMKTSTYGGRSFVGKVSTVGAAADISTRLFPVDIVFSNPDFSLKPGMAAAVDITVASYINVIVVPQAILFTEEDKTTCFIVKNNLAESREVGVGPSRFGQVMLRAGVVEGDTVIIAGQHSLKPGQKINISIETVE